MKTQQPYFNELVVNGKETGIVFETPIYAISKIKKFFNEIKKGDSVWYKFVANPTLAN